MTHVQYVDKKGTKSSMHFGGIISWWLTYANRNDLRHGSTGSSSSTSRRSSKAVWIRCRPSHVASETASTQVRRASMTNRARCRLFASALRVRLLKGPGRWRKMTMIRTDSNIKTLKKRTQDDTRQTGAPSPIWQKKRCKKGSINY